ncbi:MAG: hypothetical protein L3J03_08520 [Desulfobacterales bacterium]|nr:hypothetical protein [Desulfobacterales bacterium]
MPVSVYQWLRFVHLGLRSILVLFEQARMGEDEVLVNAYQPGKILLWLRWRRGEARLVRPSRNPGIFPARQGDEARFFQGLGRCPP